MAFDVKGALAEGYTPSEIADHLASTRKFDIAGARAEGYSDDEIISHLDRGVTGGVMESLIGGAKRLGSSTLTGLAAPFGAEEAALKGIERGAGITERPGASLDEVKRKYAEEGFFPAAREAISQIPAGLAEQVPFIGEMAAGARLGAAFTPPVLPIVGPLAKPIGGILGGLAGPFIAQSGTNVERQAQVQQEAGKPLDVSLGKAYGYALPSAALDVASMRFGLGKLLGIGERELGTAAANRIAKETVLEASVKGVGKTALSELPTEVAQQMLERAQAGLDLTSPDAIKEYTDVAYQAALLSPLGGASRVMERSDAQQQVTAEANKVKEANAVPPVVEFDAPTGVEIADPVTNEVKELVPSEISEITAPESATLTPLTSLPTNLDTETIKAFGFKPNSLAFKAMQKIDPTTVYGAKAFETIIEKNQNKIKTAEQEASVEQFRQLIVDSQKAKENPDVIIETTPAGKVATSALPAIDRTGLGSSVQVPGRPGVGITGGPSGLEPGGVGPAGPLVSEPAVRTDGEYAALEAPAVEPTAIAVPEVVAPEATEVVSPVAPEVVTPDVTPTPEVVAPESTEVMPTAEELMPETKQEAEYNQADVRKDAFKVAAKLRSIDPYHPALDVLRDENITPDAIEAARQEIIDLEATAYTEPGEAQPMEEAALADIPEMEGEDEFAKFEAAKDLLGTYVRQKIGNVQNLTPEEQVSFDQAMVALADVMYHVVKQGAKSMGHAISKARQALGESAKYIPQEEYKKAYSQAVARVAEVPTVTPETDLDALFVAAGGGTTGPITPSKPFQDFRDDPKNYVSQKKKDFGRFLAEQETMWLSSDAGLQRGLRDGIASMGKSWDEVRKMLFSASTAQALHDQGVAHQFLEMGDITYDETMYKFIVSKGKGSWTGIVNAIKQAAQTHNVSYEKMQAYAHQALIARRLSGLKKSDRKVYIHLTDAQIKAGEDLFKRIPELNDVVDQWTAVREGVLKFAVESGLYDESTAQELLDVMDYVPFYRVEQLAERAGPKEYAKGLLDTAKDKRFKGSEQEINNVFDNMERWASYVISKGIKNKTAQNLTDAAMQYLPDEVREVNETARGMEENTISIWRDGKLQKYEFDDPLYIHAFTGVQSIALPALKGWAWFTDVLRQNIVLNPLFSIGQLSQDAFGAMFVSGVKHPFSLPAQVVSEFVKTLRGTSTAHADLKALGAVGVRDYSSEVSRLDAEIAAGLRQPKLSDKFLNPLRALSMASDNAVRQAIYNQTMKETNGDKALAVERAFEVINFRRAGAGKATSVLRQTVPFFGAYLQAMNVAAKVISGRGIAPSQKAEARKVLASTTMKVFTLGLIYSALVSDDEDYKKLDPTVRDRHLIIPGSGGLSIPLRADVFTLFAKIIPEHIYQMTMVEATEDSTKATKAMKDAFLNAILSPNVAPQAIKPALEIVTNHNFFTGRPIVGQFEQTLDVEKQYSMNTSELAKVLGTASGTSPLKWDHLMRAYFGYTGSTALMATDNIIAAGMGAPRPDKSFQDLVASIPGMSAFASREFGTRDINDFYELRESVGKAVSTFNYLKTYGTAEERKAYREEHKDLLSVKSRVNRINDNLSKLRKQERLISEAPETKYSAEEKQAKIHAINERRQRMLKDISQLRARAGL